MATFVAKRGPLTISVLESGAIKAKEQEVIRNEVEGRTTIISIVPEGTRVKKGDLLVELDASTMDDERIDQEIQVQNAEAAFINAKETLAIAENQAKSDIELAELTLKFAKQDLKKYRGRAVPQPGGCRREQGPGGERGADSGRQRRGSGPRRSSRRSTCRRRNCWRTDWR